MQEATCSPPTLLYILHVCLRQGADAGKKQDHARRDLFGATVEDIW